MATISPSAVPSLSREERPRADRPPAGMAWAMAAVIVLAFSFQFAMGRSTFASPWLTHAHAVTFMGWVGIFVLQTTLGARRHMRLHRRLGWFSVAWMGLMIVMGTAVTVTMARNGTTPFFFRPQHFLVFDPLNVLTFAAMSGAAIRMRRRTDWHARLHLCAMALLMGPAFGRLLPMPLLIPYAYECAGLACASFLIVGAVIDLRRRGAVHPAWWCGFAALAAMIVVGDLVTFSPAGDALYGTVTAGTPGAARPGLAFPAPPAGPLVTGRG